ncbi:hypothetical protein WJX77_011624 [Trebouxia sp. C0004]
MTTRASTARGQDKQQFQGRVRKWRRQWDIAGDTAKYKLLRWVSTEERTEERTGSRFPGLLPVVKPVSQRQFMDHVPQKALSTDQQQAGTATTIRDAKLSEMSLLPAQHTGIYQDPSSQVAENSFNISATDSLLPGQSQTPQLNGTASRQKLPAFEPDRQMNQESEGIADTMQDGKSYNKMQSLSLIGHNGYHDNRSP